MALAAALIWAVTRSSAAPYPEPVAVGAIARNVNHSILRCAAVSCDTIVAYAGEPLSAARRHLRALITSSGAARAKASTGAPELQRQRAGTTLSEAETDTVTRMIENSDNDAANDTSDCIGGREEVVDL